VLGIQNLSVFVTAGLLLNVTPGPDTLYILGRTVAQGRRAGVASVLGISSGCLVHTIAAAAGLSAILVASTWGFACVKWLGAAYLVCLGVRMIVVRQPPAAVDERSPRFRREGFAVIYRQAVLTNVLNPKVALFFLAFLPQFIEPAGPKVVPFLLLGGVFTFNGTLWCLVLVFFAAQLSAAVRRSGGASVWMNRAAGVLFIGLGARLALNR
jgi:threonine/homoserine/homoserine lactone efflux protein